MHRHSPEEVAAWRARGQLDVVNSRTGQVLPILTDVLDDVIRHGSTLLDIRAAAARLDIPWLVVHGESDVTVPVAEARALHAAGGASAELMVVPDAGHTFETVHPWNGPTPAFDAVTDASVAWFGRHLR